MNLLPPVETDSSQSKEAARDLSTANTETNSQPTTFQNDGKGTVSISTQNRHTGKLNSNDATKKETAKQEKIQAEITKTNGPPGGQDYTVRADKAKETDATASGAIRDEASSMRRERKAADVRTDSGYIASAPQTVSAGKENIIVLQRNKSAEPIPEVVVGKSRKDSTYRRPHIVFEEAEPENGAAYYDDYIVQNLQMPDEELQKNISGEVKLSFDINNAGEAVNIAVEKSLCAECDKEAIRLLKQGPKWKKKNKKGKLSIKF